MGRGRRLTDQERRQIVRERVKGIWVSAALKVTPKTVDGDFDLIFLDGDHSAAAVYREIPLALGLLRPGGVILLHDYFPDGRPLWGNGEPILGPFKGARKHMRDGAGFDVIPLGRLEWPTKLGSNVTSLALVVRRAI